MKKILIALVAIFSIAFIKHTEASTGLMMIKETASYFTINKIIKILEAPSCGVKGCEYPGKHDEKHENQKFPRPFLWDSDAERYREASKQETADINNKTEVDFPSSEEDEDYADLEEEDFDEEDFDEEVFDEDDSEEEEIIEEEEEEDEADEIDDFFKDEYGDDEEDEEYEEDVPARNDNEARETKSETNKTPQDQEQDTSDDESQEEEDDYFDEEEESDEPLTDEENLEDLDISDWGIQLKEKLDKEIEKVEKEVDKEIEKLKKRRDRRNKRDTPKKNKDL